MSDHVFEEVFSKDRCFETYNQKIKNKSGRGLDGINHDIFGQNLDAHSDKFISKIKSKQYRFTPYLEVVKSKGRGKQPRVISKPSIRDKLVLSLVKDYLHAGFPKSVPNKLPNTYIRDVKEVFEKNKGSDFSYLKVDIKGFYDNLCQDRLLGLISKSIDDDRVISLVRRAIKNKTVPKGYRKKDSSKYFGKKGVPQGLSISNILASIYMKEFDDYFCDVGLGYFRYVDDILIVAKTDDISDIEEQIYDELEKIGLSSHDKDGDDRKTETGKACDSFEYLGYKISSNKITVRDSTVDRFIESIIAMFADHKHNDEHRVKKSKFITMDHMRDIFVLKINEKLGGALGNNKRYGWLFYFIEINDVYLLHKVDGIIKSQFERLSGFGNKIPEQLSAKNPNGICSVVKAYYAAKYDTYGGYIHNYDSYKTIAHKISFLIKYGYIWKAEEASYSEKQIELMFEDAKNSHLLKLEEDVGSIS